MLSGISSMTSEMLEPPDPQSLRALELRGQSELASAADEEALRNWHSRFLGDKGEVKAAIKKVGSIPPAERRAYGQAVNLIKDTLTAGYEAAAAGLKAKALEQSLTTQT